MWIKAGGWLAAILMAFGFALGAFGVTGRATATALAQDGVMAEATIVGLDHVRRREKEDHYNVTYSFALPDGAAASGFQEVSAAFFAALSVGQVVDVRFLPADPGISEIEMNATANKSWIALLSSAALLAGGAGYGWVSAARARATVVLRDQGEVRTATVTQHRIFQPDDSDKKPTSGVAVWRDSTGATGETLSRRPETLPAVGDSLTIYADPAGKAKSVWEGDVGSRA